MGLTPASINYGDDFDERNCNLLPSIRPKYSTPNYHHMPMSTSHNQYFNQIIPNVDITKPEGLTTGVYNFNTSMERRKSSRLESSFMSRKRSMKACLAEIESNSNNELKYQMRKLSPAVYRIPKKSQSDKKSVSSNRIDLLGGAFFFLISIFYKYIF
uniref:BHLH domain-containing protein n=1 Tax=Parastrongyloides trichosuri TaxID=131310 RepID=A0A0N4ZTS0_PARTI